MYKQGTFSEFLCTQPYLCWLGIRLHLWNRVHIGFHPRKMGLAARDQNSVSAGIVSHSCRASMGALPLLVLAAEAMSRHTAATEAADQPGTAPLREGAAHAAHAADRQNLRLWGQQRDDGAGIPRAWQAPPSPSRRDQPPTPTRTPTRATSRPTTRLPATSCPAPASR